MLTSCVAKLKGDALLYPFSRLGATFTVDRYIRRLAIHRDITGGGARATIPARHIWQAGDQVAQVDAAERLHHRRQLGQHLADVLRDFARAGPAALAVADDHDTLYAAHWFGDRARDLRELVDQQLRDRSLVVFLPGARFL